MNDELIEACARIIATEAGADWPMGASRYRRFARAVILYIDRLQERNELARDDAAERIEKLEATLRSPVSVAREVKSVELRFASSGAAESFMEAIFAAFKGTDLRDEEKIAADRVGTTPQPSQETTMTEKQISGAKLVRLINTKERELAALRDKLRELHADLSELTESAAEGLENLDEACAALERAADDISQFV